MILAVALGAAVLILLAKSCATGPGFDYNGTWEGNRRLSNPGADPDALYTLGWVQLTIKDSRFNLLEGGMATGGPVRFEGDHIVLHRETILNNQPIGRAGPDAEKKYPDISVTPQKDATLLFSNPAAIDGKPVVLMRKKP